MPAHRTVPNRPSPFDSAGDVVDTYSIRCPHCGDVSAAHEYEQPTLYEDGTHAVWCHACDVEFEVQTSVMIMFTSPCLATKDSK